MHWYFRRIHTLFTVNYIFVLILFVLYNFIYIYIQIGTWLANIMFLVFKSRVKLLFYFWYVIGSCLSCARSGRRRERSSVGIPASMAYLYPARLELLLQNHQTKRSTYAAVNSSEWFTISNCRPCESWRGRSQHWKKTLLQRFGCHMCNNQWHEAAHNTGHYSVACIVSRFNLEVVFSFMRSDICRNVPLNLISPLFVMTCSQQWYMVWNIIFQFCL